MRSFFNKKKKTVAEAKKEDADRERTESAADLPPTAKSKGKPGSQRRENQAGSSSKQTQDPDQKRGLNRDFQTAKTQRNSSPPPPPLRSKRGQGLLSESETESYSSETDSDGDQSLGATGELRQMKPPRERRYTSTSGESESSDESESSYESEEQFIRRDPQVSRPVEVVSLLRQRSTEQEAIAPKETVLNEMENGLAREGGEDLNTRPLPTVFPTLEDIITGRSKLATGEGRDRDRNSRKPAPVLNATSSKGEKRTERKAEKSLASQTKRRPVGKKDEESERVANESTKTAEERTSEKQSRLGDGCYLRYDPSNGGIIYAQWSVTGMAPEDVLAYFEPKMSVSRRKYTQNEGRVDLVKGVGSDPKKYLEAWTYFWLMAREEKGFITSTLDLVDQDELKVDLWTLDYEGNVNSVVPGKGVNTSNVDCLAALPRSSQAFEGVDFVTKSFFVNVSQRCGMNISFER